MKKVLLVLLITTCLVNAQSIIIKNDKTRHPNSAIRDNGATKYLSKSSAINMNLHETNDRITTQTDRDFETSVGHWMGVGTGTIVQSSAQKHADTYSGLITINSAGDGAQLPFANITALTQDVNSVWEKYTFQVWVYNTLAGIDTIKIGNQKVFKSISATTWTLFPFTFQATANEVNKNIIITSNTVTTIFIDDCSLKKRSDRLINIWANLSAMTPKSGSYTLFSYGDDVVTLRYPTYNGFLYTSNAAGGAFRVDIYSPSDLNSNDGKFHLYSVVDNETIVNGGKIYRDGVLINSGTILRGIATGSTLQITNDGGYFNGKIGEVQIVTFTDIAQSNLSATTLLQAYQNNLFPHWVGGSPNIVAWYSWDGSIASQIYHDISNTGNNLTATGTVLPFDKLSGMGLYRTNLNPQTIPTGTPFIMTVAANPTISMKGSGIIAVAWGDTTDYDYYSLTSTAQNIAHNYKSPSTTHTVNIYYPSNITYWSCTDNANYTFNMSEAAKMPSLTTLRVNGTNTITGTLSIPITVTTLSLVGCSIVGYNTQTFSQSMNYFYITINSGAGLNQAQADQLFIDLNGSAWAGSSRTARATGSSIAAVSATSLAARTDLMNNKSVTVFTN